MNVDQTPKYGDDCGGCTYLKAATRQKSVDFESSYLFASLLWGSIGVGYWIYGKKQREMMPMIGGVAMVALSYLISSWLLMSLLGVGSMIAIHWLMRRGD